ncbi:acyl-CoA dehydrogenase family protein [Desulfosporosinus nitroreducens]|uniref:Acyl-CoA dehydrogenase family protein n=1 Tax=Desulfosporosinus nitroreducens TaxID=2018668 RepID=A0ABT8QRY8_9FIRM|nr:acyl-CoA dehydrogenase family protein [Desulfosporosinus nitroreducens]MDO0823364.1 acyl-CoA dehydrogenase family protein [Desulfosporosinus nitroreducens]
MSSLPKGGSFLFGQTNPQDIFTPEDFTLEHKMIYRTTAGFITDSVLTRMDELENKKEGLINELLEAASELGLNGADISEEYGGMEMDKISTTIIAECIGRAGSFAQTQGGQAGIGSMPIVMFGTHEQKKKYLPGLANAEKVGAYALTEPGAGSDALSAKTRADLSPDGKYYILNGTKQFITNAGMADIFIVYAKIDGDKFTAFIVDGDSEGLSTGAEEHKMGIKGSSTRSVIFEDVKVPVENLLFEIGRGHVVAFNILNLGRFKLAATSVGMAKFALELAATYANDRKQFGTPIANFGLIKEKLAEMAIKIYVTESMVYRTGGMLENMMNSLDTSGNDGGLVAAKGIEEYALECSMNKVFGTETLGYAVDEGVQIHGGYGFSSEYTIERLYRDARIYRIFEGTNEINRVLIPTTLLRRAAKGELPLQEAIEKLKGEIAAGSLVRKGEAGLVQAAKDIFLLTTGAGLQKYGKDLQKHQEILGRLADLAIRAFAIESAWLRSQKAAANDGGTKAKLKQNMAMAYINSTVGLLEYSAKETLTALAEGEELASLLDNLQRLTKYTTRNTVSLRQEIAAAISEDGKYAV